MNIRKRFVRNLPGGKELRGIEELASRMDRETQRPSSFNAVTASPSTLKARAES
jgi:hypothetical protein